jgi:hypothetical protein
MEVDDCPESGTPVQVTGVEPASSRRRGVSGSGLMMYLLAVAPPDPAFYAVSVETLTFLFTDIEGSTALLRRLVLDGAQDSDGRRLQQHWGCRCGVGGRPADGVFVGGGTVLMTAGVGVRGCLR